MRQHGAHYGRGRESIRSDSCNFADKGEGQLFFEQEMETNKRQARMQLGGRTTEPTGQAANGSCRVRRREVVWRAKAAKQERIASRNNSFCFRTST